jgi:hypothetical protein
MLVSTHRSSKFKTGNLALDKPRAGLTVLVVLLIAFRVAGDVLWLLVTVLETTAASAKHVLEEAKLRACNANKGEESEQERRKVMHFW